MTASPETLVVAAYVFAHALPIPRPGPEGEITDAELISLAVAQASMGESSDRKFLGLIGYRLEGWFPHLPDQSQYNRRLRRLVPQIVMVQLEVAELVASGRTRLADGTLIGCANYAGCASKSDFAGEAGYGYCPSKSRFYWGMRLVLVTDEMGVPVGYDLVAPGEGEREPLFRLAQAHPDAVIESVFSNLKRQMRLEEHLAKTPGGLVQRVAQRLLALTLGMFINAQLGRPLRGLVAYDGR